MTMEERRLKGPDVTVGKRIEWSSYVTREREIEGSSRHWREIGLEEIHDPGEKRIERNLSHWREEDWRDLMFPEGGGLEAS